MEKSYLYKVYEDILVYQLKFSELLSVLTNQQIEAG